MNEAHALKAVKDALKPVRYEHTVRVLETADQLCSLYGGNRNKIRLAAILHDYAKYRPAEEMRNKVSSSDKLPDNLQLFGDELLHSFVGAVFVEEELEVKDREILEIIAVHTTGKRNMTLEQKIVFLADYIEPGRTFSGAETARKKAEKSLDEACLTVLSQTISFLSEKRWPIYPDTFEAYNDLAIRRKEDIINE
ncbi:bis(5'-nucleosyl)-tetraphosphatase (symmetrical) YqeK [Alkalicoccus halolimnae]|uniref:bis(5'-nucleosyl)-tetraphosphatase (symmetrical) n=1 Tax=Alkalicoccus halolimnae TaxID=1667239 RepID=A0A5C7FJJ6_9BACI|nr:bis(5'-nucleosyl)-tetraphosphatase (symmetrical) YqeK [Alkalicoccus halolimnae]TXF86464.1 HD domain-containing protein [Alkalicoccus halolimnae]